MVAPIALKRGFNCFRFWLGLIPDPIPSKHSRPIYPFRIPSGDDTTFVESIEITTRDLPFFETTTR